MSPDAAPDTRKLGRLPTVHDPRTLRFAAYTTKVPKPPAEVHRSHNEFAWPMFDNDRIGDCTIAAAAHMLEGWAFATGAKKPTITQSQVVTAYTAVSGYNPKTGANDNGAVELDVLRYWHRTGIAGRKIGAFASVDPRNANEIRQSVWLFGGVYLGIALPTSAQTQKIWDTPATGLQGDGAPGSWGGHAVPVVSYDANRLAVITWGAVQLMTWRFFGAYVDEAYAILSTDLLKGGKSPEGFSLSQLQSDLSAL
ncbi:MAG: hypothetical protein LC685_02110 [Actinobacteria bacterium]|nr:hypothetical protein [Actinomycetota bacterium]